MYTERTLSTIQRPYCCSLLGMFSAATVLSTALPRVVAAIRDARWPGDRGAIVINSLGNLGTYSRKGARSPRAHPDVYTRVLRRLQNDFN